MCELDADAYFVPPGSTYMIQRSWSDAAAAKSRNPCVPAPAAPYFNSMPVVSDTVSFNESAYAFSGTTRGVTIPVGQSKTIDLQLFSEAPTAGPWTVSAYDYESFFCTPTPSIPCPPPNLALALDGTTGQNGDTLHLTITVMSADTALGAEAFLVFSDLGGQENLSVGLVGN
jgi:hypothetical protein